jgi:hypothetical protein
MVWYASSLIHRRLKPQAGLKMSLIATSPRRTMANEGTHQVPKFGETLIEIRPSLSDFDGVATLPGTGSTD